MKDFSIHEALLSAAAELSTAHKVPLGTTGIEEQAFFLEGLAEDIADRLKGSKSWKIFMGKIFMKIFKSNILVKKYIKINESACNNLVDKVIGQMSKFVVAEIQACFAESGAHDLERSSGGLPKEFAELLFANTSAPAGRQAIKAILPDLLK